jgi:hypothetical protein
LLKHLKNLKQQQACVRATDPPTGKPVVVFQKIPFSGTPVKQKQRHHPDASTQPKR